MATYQKTCILIALLLALPLSTKADLYCKYSCDTNKARKAGNEFLEKGTLGCQDCFRRCNTRDLIPFFCELFSVVLNGSSAENPNTPEKLSEKLIQVPHWPRQPISGKNNYAHHVLKHVNVHVCQKRLNLINSAVPAKHHQAVMASLSPFLETMHKKLEKKYPTFQRHQTKKQVRMQGLKNTHSCKSEPKKKHMMLRLFNWCYNYCSGARAPKTFVTLEDLVKKKKTENPGEIIDFMRKTPKIFQKKTHVSARRAYKCLTQCSLKNVERYLCYLLDDVDMMDESKGDVPKKMLDVIGQILLMTPDKGTLELSGKNKLEMYLKNPRFKARCMKMFEHFYYRGENYQINVDYLQRTYIT